MTGVNDKFSVIKPDWPVAVSVKAFVTTRTGGISAGEYSELNLAMHVGDITEAVDQNRLHLQQTLQLPEAPRWLDQVHGGLIVPATNWSLGCQADGISSQLPGQVCVVLTADCLPVFMADRKGEWVGVAHAGWRGLANGVLTNLVAASKLAPERLIAWLGPAIGPDQFEVGPEVEAAFSKAEFKGNSAFRRGKGDRFYADLYQLARNQLAFMGIREVYGGGFCTFTQSEKFFSHRRQAPCGRMASLIWLSE